MSDFRVIPLGVGNAFSAAFYTTCFAVGSGNSWILIDCPHPIRKMLAEGSRAAGIALDLDRIEFIALSHLHADHACGLEDLGFFFHFLLGRRARLLTHPDISGRMWDGLLAAGMGENRDDPCAPFVTKRLDDFFDVVAVEESKPVTLGAFSIECRKTLHSIPTTAFRITSVETGRILGYSGDTAFDPSLLEWLSPCDLIFHEVTTLAESRVHTPYRHLEQLPAQLRAKMRLYHYPDDFDFAASAIEPLREGRIYSV